MYSIGPAPADPLNICFCQMAGSSAPSSATQILRHRATLLPIIQQWSLSIFAMRSLLHRIVCELLTLTLLKGLEKNVSYNNFLPASVLYISEHGVDSRFSFEGAQDGPRMCVAD